VQKLAEIEKTENKDYYWQMYADVWAFHKKYINGVCDDDSFWEQVVNESTEISKKHHRNKFIIGLLLNEIDEMERIYKARKREDSGSG
jgi:hypothetical protein